MKKEIWVVDDDAVWPFTINLLIEHLGYDCRYCYFEDGRHASSALEDTLKNKPSVIIIKLNTAFDDSLQLLESFDRRLQAYQAKLSVFIIDALSAYKGSSPFSKFKTLCGFRIKNIYSFNLRMALDNAFRNDN